MSHSICLAALILTAPPAAPAGDALWAGFRGNNANGIAEGHALPIAWDAESGAGIAWTTPLPGLAHSSPVIAGDRIFVTTAVGDAEASLKIGLYGAGEPVPDEGEQSWRVYGLDRSDGTVLWEREAIRGVPKIERHPKATHASSTPATDGRYVVAFFGSEGLYCYDLEGTLLWSRNFGVLDAGAFDVPEYQWGFGSSPIIHDEWVIVQCDVQGDSFVAALALSDGQDVWRTPRNENPTWCTPTVVGSGADAQVVCNGYLSIAGYDLDSGSQRWWMHGGGDVPVPTPVAAHGLIYVTNGHGRDKPVYAIHATADGAVSVENDPAENLFGLAWFTLRLGSYMQTPLPYGEELFVCGTNGVLNCFDARTGREHYRQRLGDGRTGFTASAVAGDGKLYYTSEEGDVHVVRAGARFELLGVNSMGETCMASPAIADGTLYWRTRGRVVAVTGTE